MPTPPLGTVVRRRPSWGSPALAVLVVALLAPCLGASPRPVPLTSSPIGSRGAASTESRALDDEVRGWVGAGLAAAGQVDVAPFDVVGLSWASGSGEGARVRVRNAGTWGEWRRLEAEGDDGPDPGAAEGAGARVVSKPLWVAGADGYEVELPAGVGDAAVHLVRDHPEPAAAGVRLAAARKRASGEPAISSRSSWDARPPKAAPAIAPQLKMAFVHHTVSSNDYAAGDVPAMLRGIQAYHMDVNGWDDIGYNFLVDRFGTIWEGRSGGTTRDVVGAHAAGFNTFSVGVAVLGEFSTVAPTSASTNAVGRLLGWRLGLAGVDPEGRARMPTGGGTRSFAAISGHRDADATECPGAELYAELGTIRARSAGRQPVA